MPRPDDGLIHAWLDGELDAVETARVAKLVAEDAEWGAAAAEARGLIAASSRILGALDEVPGDVIPVGSRAAPTPATSVRAAERVLKPRFAVRPWMRIAAAMVLVVGTAYVAREGTRDDPGTPEAFVLQGAAAAADSAASPAMAPTAPTSTQTTASTTLPVASVAGATSERRAREDASDARGAAASTPAAAPPVAAPRAAAPAIEAVAAEIAPQPMRVAGGVASDPALGALKRSSVARERMLDAPSAVLPSASRAYAGRVPLVIDGCWRTATAARADTVLIAPRIVRTLGDTLVIATGNAVRDAAREDLRGGAREAMVRRVGGDTLRGVMRNSAGASVPFDAVRVSCPRAP